jgi:hypothetical protein
MTSYQQQIGISKLDTGGTSINSSKIAEFILNSLLNQFMKKANEVISQFAQDIFEPVFVFNLFIFSRKQKMSPQLLIVVLSTMTNKQKF